jgi:hypothetical protein
MTVDSPGIIYKKLHIEKQIPQNFIHNTLPYIFITIYNFYRYYLFNLKN